MIYNISCDEQEARGFFLRLWKLALVALIMAFSRPVSVAFSLRSPSKPGDSCDDEKSVTPGAESLKMMCFCWASQDICNTEDLGYWNINPYVFQSISLFHTISIIVTVYSIIIFTNSWRNIQDSILSLGALGLQSTNETSSHQDMFSRHASGGSPATTARDAVSTAWNSYSHTSGQAPHIWTHRTSPQFSIFTSKQGEMTSKCARIGTILPQRPWGLSDFLFALHSET